MSRLVSAVEDVWTHVSTIHPDVPPVVVSIAAGEAQTNGHYATARWNLGPTRISELFLSGESLARGALPTLVTIVHEACHGANETREKKDTSRQGRYHNQAFKATAEEFGLTVSKDPKWGWLTSGHGPTDALLDTYKDVLETLKEALEDFYRLSEKELRGGEEEEEKENGQVTCVCQCKETARGIKLVPGPRRIHLTRTVLALGGIACEVCGALFEEEVK